MRSLKTVLNDMAFLQIFLSVATCESGPMLRGPFLEVERTFNIRCIPALCPEGFPCGTALDTPAPLCK